MHRGLSKLMLLQAKATGRRTFRGAKSVRGATFLVVGILLFVSWLGPNLFITTHMRKADPGVARMFFPMALLVYCVMNLVTSAGDRAIAFTPAEVDFLFPGPFSRRQLLGYKIGKSFIGALFTATLFSVLVLRYIQYWLAGWIGVLLALMFMQLFSMSLVLIGEMIGEGAYTRGRRILLFGLGFGIIACLAPNFKRGSAHNLPEMATSFAHSLSGRIVLTPFNVFGQIVTADPTQPEILRWIAIALTMIAVLLLIVMMLDAHYLETAASVGMKRYEQVRRMRSGAGMAGRVAATSRLRLPMPPRFAGAGPIAWRQMVSALRKSKGLLITLIFVCLIIGPGIYVGGIHEHPESLIIGAICWLTFMLANLLRFDFRGDVDQIDTLKALPVTGTAVAVAELVTPVVMLTLCQLALMVGVNMMLNIDPKLLATIFVYAVPMNVMLIGVENLIFLIFPVRIVAVSPGDLQGVGRQMVVFLLKSLALLACAGVAAGVGAAAWWISGQSVIAFATTSLAVLLVEIVAMIPLVVLAFRRFDPSVDTPT